MNKVILIGNMASDPEYAETQNGVPRCTFRIAVNRKFLNQDGVREADFLPVICWRNNANFAQMYLSKGRKVAVEGSVQTRSYNAQDGTKRYATEIVADNLEALDWREPQQTPMPNVQHAQRAVGEMRERAQNPEPDRQMGFTEVEDDDRLPF